MTSQYVVGVDEVGRGPLAGPVTVCAVMWLDTPETWKAINALFPVIKDSKKLSSKKRKAWFDQSNQLQQQGVITYALCSKDNHCIDTCGIAQSIRDAVAECLQFLVDEPLSAHLVLDGGLSAPKQYAHQKSIIRGDETELPIALASIVAKVTRDMYMEQQETLYPGYGFVDNKGYGTAKHCEAIATKGLSALHRKTFCTHVLKSKTL